MKAEQRIGSAGEEQAALALRRLGIEMVEEIATPVIVSRASGKPVIVAWKEPVSGDHRGILPGGRSVLVETKTIHDRNLRWSDLREHQPGRLDRHADLGGLSLLVWVHSSGIYIMVWPVPGFGPGRSIEPRRAERLCTEIKANYNYPYPNG